MKNESFVFFFPILHNEVFFLSYWTEKNNQEDNKSNDNGHFYNVTFMILKGLLLAFH